MITEDDQFNKSLLLILLNGQQYLQWQSLNVMQDINCRHGYDSLMQVIPIYDGKNMDLADWGITNRKHGITYKW